MRHKPGRAAFTLIELIIVIAIMGILAAFLFVAVQQSRAAASRIECQVHLKQIGLALHAYHGNHQTLPPGMSLNIDHGAYPYMSWNIRILPYIEQSSLFRDVQAAYKTNTNFLSPPHRHLRQIVLPIFSCPADPYSSVAETLADGQRVAFTSYLGVEGTDQQKHDGMLFLDSRIRFADVTDGVSNTIMVGERPPSSDGRFGWWYAGWGQQRTGSGEMVLGVRERLSSDEPCEAGPYHFGPGWNGDVCDYLHFWSEHAGGANFLFADGSVRFLSYNTDPIMPALATCAGREVVQVPD